MAVYPFHQRPVMQMHILSFLRTPSARALRGASPTERPTHAWFMRPPFNLGGDTFDIFPRQSRRRLSLQSLNRRTPSPAPPILQLRWAQGYSDGNVFFKDISALCDVTDDGTEIAILKLLFLLIRKKHLRPFFLSFPPRRPRLKASSHDDNDIRPLTATLLTGNSLAN